MSKPSHDDVEQLTRDIILPFYHVRRDMPLPIGERRLENDAEHSWSVALLACALAPQIDPKLDVGKIAQFAIAHDLVEVYADDNSPFDSQEKLNTKAEREEAALARIATTFSHFPWIVQTIQDYERRDTDEANFVYAIDKYIAVMYDYIDEGQLFRERQVTHAEYSSSLETHHRKAQSHPEVAKYYQAVRDLLAARPEFFHTDK